MTPTAFAASCRPAADAAKAAGTDIFAVFYEGHRVDCSGEPAAGKAFLENNISSGPGFYYEGSLGLSGVADWIAAELADFCVQNDEECTEHVCVEDVCVETYVVGSVEECVFTDDFNRSDSNTVGDPDEDVNGDYDARDCQGPAGDQGPQGDQGQQGEKGDKGDPGKDATDYLPRDDVDGAVPCAPVGGSLMATVAGLFGLQLLGRRRRF